MKGEHATNQPAPDRRGEFDNDESLSQDKTVAFVIVLTLEPGNVGTVPEWRWRVRSVQTGEERHFRRIADVLAYVAATSAVGAPE